VRDLEGVELKTGVEYLQVTIDIMVASNKACDNRYNRELNKHQDRLNSHSSRIRSLNQMMARVELLEDSMFKVREEVANMKGELCHCGKEVH